MSLDSFPQNTPSPEKEKNREQLFEEMAVKGRLIAHTWLTPELASLKPGGQPELQSLVNEGNLKPGNQDVVDREQPRRLVRDAILQYVTPNRERPLFGDKIVTGGRAFEELGKLQNIDAALTIAPLIKKEVIMGEEKVLEKPHWYTPAKEVTRKVRKGEREVQVSISEINGDHSSSERAYKVVLVERIKGLVAGRGGVTCTYTLLLPEDLARNVFALLSEKPSVIREIVEKFDRVMAKQLSFVENQPKRLLVVPEGQPESAYELDSMRRPKSIKEEFVKTISQ